MMRCGSSSAVGACLSFGCPNATIFYIEAIPTLASGKADLRQARAIALEKVTDRCHVAQNPL